MFSFLTWTFNTVGARIRELEWPAKWRKGTTSKNWEAAIDTDVTQFEWVCSWHADCRNVHHSCRLLIECWFHYHKSTMLSLRIWHCSLIEHVWDAMDWRIRQPVSLLPILSNFTHLLTKSGLNHLYVGLMWNKNADLNNEVLISVPNRSI